MAKVSARTIEEYVNAMITQGKKNGNVLSLTEVGDYLSKLNISKEEIDEIYDRVEKNGISLVDSREPNSEELADEEGDDDGVVLTKTGEIDVEATVPKTLPTDDVRR